MEDRSKKINTENENTNIERSGDANFDFEKEVSVHQKPETDTLFNDYILRDEWEQLYVAEDTSNYSQRDVQL